MTFVILQFLLCMYFGSFRRNEVVVCPPCKNGGDSNIAETVEKLVENEFYVHESNINRFEIPIEENCHVCEFPNYEKSLFYNGVYVYADAFTTRQGKEIVILANPPDSRKRVEWKGTFHAELFFNFRISPNIQDDKSLKIACIQQWDHYNRGVRFSCPVSKSNQWIHNYCYTIQLIKDEPSFSGFSESNERSLLRDPLLVRQCHVVKKEGEKKRDLGICVNLSSGRIRFIVEFIEYHLMVGVKHFIIYLQPIDEETLLKEEEEIEGFSANDERLGRLYDSRASDVLKIYVEIGVVTLFKWPRVRNTDPKGMYFTINSGWKARHREDQIASQNDCLNRFRDKFQWLMMIDGDEYIVPVRNDQIVQVLDEIDTSFVFGIEVLSWFYSEKKKRTFPKSHLLTETYPIFDRVEPEYRKTIVNTDLANMVAIHQVGDFIENTVPYVANDTTEIYVAHYNRMKVHDSNPFMTYEDEQKYTTTPIGRFLVELKDRVAKIEDIINFSDLKFEY